MDIKLTQLIQGIAILILGLTILETSIANMNSFQSMSDSIIKLNKKIEKLEHKK